MPTSKITKTGKTQRGAGAKSKTSQVSGRKLATTLSDKEHAFVRPDMYIGSVSSTTKTEYVCDLDEFRLVSREVSIVPGLMRLFIEPMSNAVDNKWTSQQQNLKMTEILVTLDRETGEVTIKNDGASIPVETTTDDAGETVWNPELIFGRFRSGTNYDDTESRLTSGRNGMGIKLTNLFSTRFKVVCRDPSAGKEFSMQWVDNMEPAGSPTVTTKTIRKGSTLISFTPDFARFGVNGWTDDHIAAIRKYVVDMAMITRVRVKYNGETIPVRTLKEYACMYPSLEIPTESVEETKSDTDSTTETACTESVYFHHSADGCTSEVLLSPAESFEQISFVNGVQTFDGGEHVKAWSSAIFEPLLEKFRRLPNGECLTIQNIKSLFRIIVVCTLPNPTFTSQEKTCLATPTPPTEVKRATITTISKWSSVVRLEELIHERSLRKLSTLQKKSRSETIPGYSKANKAGKRYGSRCTLILCEGLSAKTFAVTGLAGGNWSRDYYGIFPLTGKILNVRDSKIESIGKNKVIANLLHVTGLIPGTDYSIEGNYNKLNYGRWMFACDADVDGYHIQGLAVNIIHAMFPELIPRGFLHGMSTPIVTIKLKRGFRDFYDDAEARKFIAEKQISRRSVEYYKGLGTISAEKAREVFGQHLTAFEWDTGTDNSMRLAFGKSFANQRKQWLAIDPSTLDGGIPETQTITSFIDNKLRQHAIANCARMLPSLMDGLKESQRKIVWIILTRGPGPKAEKLKVAQLAGRVAEFSEYQHGEQNLQDTIINLAQSFVGSNNIPLLNGIGQFGTRIAGGDDAAQPRYIFTKAAEILPYIYHPSDNNILQYVNCDGASVEPEHYIPVIPMVLVNGIIGIGTGYSTKIPSYNPLDLCDYVEAWLNESPTPELVPWYRGFTGETIAANAQRTKWKFTGIARRISGATVEVTELPVFMWTDKFEEYLTKLQNDGKIKSFDNHSTDVAVRFVIKETPNSNDIIPKLKLSTTITTTNMSVFDETGTIRQYTSVDKILEDFCDTRLTWYTDRKENLIESLSHQLTVLNGKLRYITEIMAEPPQQLEVFRVPESTIIAELTRREYPTVDGDYEYLRKLSTRWFSQEKLDELATEIANTTAELEQITETEEADMWLEDLAKFREAYSRIYG